jgi:predicted RND superfamily exporter protein
MLTPPLRSFTVLSRLAGLSLRRPGVVLALYALLTGAAAAGLFRLELRTDGSTLYPSGDPVVAQTVADNRRFRETDQVILLVSSRPGGPPVASPAGFLFLQKLGAQIQRLPEVDVLGVHSIANLVDPPEDLRNLRIETYFESWRSGRRSFPGMLARIRELPLAQGLFLAPDGRQAAVYVQLREGADRRELLDDLRRLAAAHAQEPFALRITGPAAAESELGDAVLRDLARLVPLTIAAFALLLWLGLRSAGGLLLPMVQVVSTLVWTLGLMGWAGVPVTLVTTILPVVLIALSMTDEVHLLERIRDRLAADPEAGRRVAAEAAFADLTAPLALSSWINAAGFLSFLTATLEPLRWFGLFAGAGILVAMLFTFSLVPALIAVLPESWIEPRRRRQDGGSAKDAGFLGPFFARHARASAIAGAVLAAAAIPGLFLLRVQDSWVDNFAPSSPLVRAERQLNRSFWGSYRYDLVFDGPPGFFWTPAGARLLEQVHGLAADAPHVGGAFSVLPIFEKAALARGDRPPVSALEAMEVRRIGALTEILRIRLHLGQLLSLDGGGARVRFFVRNADFATAQTLAADLQRRVPPLVAQAGSDITWHASGDVPVALQVVGSIVGNQLRSLAGSAALIAILLLAALRSLRLAVIVMIPVLATNLLLFAGLGYAGIPLGIATSMFAALTLGAGIDFALHYLTAWRRERQAGLSHDAAIQATLRTAGRGLRWNATVLAVGFAVLAISTVKPNGSLGLLLGVAMVLSYATTLIFLPELLRWVEGKRRGV